MDSRLPFAPSVLAIREPIAKEGLKALLEEYRGPSSVGLVNSFKE